MSANEMIKNNVTELIGNTPLLRVSRFEEAVGAEGEIVVKLEYFNPGGSVKDRVGYNMILEAELSGRLSPGATIIEPTSGNTGIGIAMVAASKGYRAILTMPETMSIERRKLLSAYGAEIVLTEGAKGMQGAVDKAEQLAAEIPGSIIAGQFINQANPDIHYKTTGPEIWRDTAGRLDYFVAGIGTGGTITGAGQFLKARNSEIKVAAVEPAKSPLLSEGKAGPHPLQGIGANFVPEILDTNIFDEIITVEGDEAMESLKTLSQTEGIFVGVSSGAALYAAAQIAKRPESKGKRIVVLLPDTGERYLSVF